MLDTVSPTATAERRAASTLDVEVAAVATAVPQNSISQSEMLLHMRRAFPQFEKMESLFGNTAIDTRYFCETRDWYTRPHTWEERTESFQRHALELLERVTLDALAEASLRIDQIDAIVTNTITGLAIPSLEGMLMNRLPFSPTVERLPIFGLGCGGGVGGLARAARMAQTMPGGNVLFLTIELCSLCARINDSKAANLISGALFGDGAAAVVLRNPAGGRGHAPILGRISEVGEYLWRSTEYILGWDIRNDGFAMVLSAELPKLVNDNLGEAVNGFLGRQGLTMADIDGYLFHPGGAKVITAAERALGLPPDALDLTREALRKYGNLSSPTALFVLKEALARGHKGRHLMAAFGPGFSAYFALINL